MCTEIKGSMTVLSGASQSSGDWFKVILFDCTSLSCVVYMLFWGGLLAAF